MRKTNHNQEKAKIIYPEKQDERIRKTLDRIRNIICNAALKKDIEWLHSDLIKESGIWRSTINRRRLSISRKYSSEVNKRHLSRTSSKIFLIYFDRSILLECKARGSVLKRLKLQDSKFIFFQVTSTLCHNRQYITAMLHCYGNRYALLRTLLKLPLGRICKENQVQTSAIPAITSRYCLDVLCSIVSEWAFLYHFNPEYTGFYAQKLRKAALLCLLGESKRNELKALLDCPPESSEEFLAVIIDKEWDKLELNPK